MDAPKLPFCRLYQKKSSNGNIYFAGRLGGNKVLMFRDRATADDGTPIWQVYLQEAPPTPGQPYEVVQGTAVNPNSLPPPPQQQRDDLDGDLPADWQS